MSIVVGNCPRCGSQAVTFDVEQSIQVDYRYNWQRIFEHFAVCRHCHAGSILIGEQANPDQSLSEDILTKLRSLSDVVNVIDYVSLKNETSEQPPDHLPDNIAAAFQEGASCLAIGCYNASAAMFRLALDVATRAMLPQGEVEGLNAKVRRDLGLRLPWLFKNKLIPSDLEELSHCIKEDGNDGVHAGILKQEDADDIVDFTRALLTRLYTEPARVKIATARRDARRNKPG
jgi:hypothetical protein